MFFYFNYNGIYCKREAPFQGNPILFSFRYNYDIILIAEVSYRCRGKWELEGSPWPGAEGRESRGPVHARIESNESRRVR